MIGSPDLHGSNFKMLLGMEGLVCRLDTGAQDKAARVYSYALLPF